MTEENVPVPELRNEDWLQDLCFCVEITEKFNHLNMELLDQNNLVTDALISIKSFKIKLNYYCLRVHLKRIMHNILHH